MSSGPQGPQDPSEQKKHVFSSKLSNNSLRTDPKHPFGATVSTKYYLQQKNTSFGQNYLKIHWKKAPDILSKLPDSNMTNPLPLFIKKERGGGKALQFVPSFFILEEPYLTILGQSAWNSKQIQKNVYFLMFQAQKPCSVHFIMLRPYKESLSDDFCAQINELWVFLCIAQQ